MSVHYSSAVWKIVMPNSGRKIVALALADMANDEGVCWPSLRAICDRCNMREEAVRDHLAALASVGILSTQPRYKDGRQTSNLYMFAPVEQLTGATPLAEIASGGRVAKIATLAENGRVAKIARGRVAKNRRGEGGENHPPENRQEGTVIETSVQKTVNGELFETPEEPKKRDKARGSQAEIEAYAAELGLPATDGQWFFDKAEGNGWKNNGKAIVDWRATMRAWKTACYLPSLKRTEPHNNHAKTTTTSRATGSANLPDRYPAPDWSKTAN